MLAWVYLIAAGLLEVVWARALDRSEGFTRLSPSLIGIAGAAVSFYLLSLALKSLPLGTAYAVWVGMGAVGVALAGILLNGESPTLLRMMFLLLIVIGIVGLKLVDVDAGAVD